LWVRERLRKETPLYRKRFWGKNEELDISRGTYRETENWGPSEEGPFSSLIREREASKAGDTELGRHKMKKEALSYCSRTGPI